MKERDDVERMIEQFYFVFQPIMKVFSETESEVFAYEVLLRSKETKRFPENLFSLLIQEESTNRILMEWYEKELEKYLLFYPNVYFDINIHPQQFIHPSTWFFLKNMKKFNRQLKIELTEHRPVFINKKDHVNYALNDSIKEVANLGYEIAIDDIGSGQNTIDLVIENIESISCFKFSLLPFRKLDCRTIINFLNLWLQLAKKQKFTFIVEGVDSFHIMNFLFDNEIYLQQGYYWSAGEEL